jgi:uncharacterized membrane protein (UPF0127 family)
MIATARGGGPIRTRTKFILVVSLAIAVAACADTSSTPDGDAANRAQVVIESEDDTVRVDVEIADDDHERRTGLMGRTSLAADAGMAFLFPEPTSSSFWMKDTLIPLSIAFWNEAGDVVAILDMHPCPEEPCPSYDPGVEFSGALEVNQGFFEEHGVEVGDRVRLVGLG